MKDNLTVKDIMSSDVITMDRYENFSTLRKILEDNNIHHILIVEGRKLIGILSTTDVLRYSFGVKEVGQNQALDQYLDRNISLDAIMQTQVIAIQQNAPVKEAAKKLYESDFHALPVVDEQQELIGIVTTKDLLGLMK